MYTGFAEVYDELMADVDYETWADFYVRLMNHYGIQEGKVCECACGTGALTIPLYRRGFQMTGVDLSQDMLWIAAQKARSSGIGIPFVRQDMRQLRLHRPMDAVLATCDGVNYLLDDRDLTAFFQAAWQALRPGGGLFFDISTPYKLENTLGDQAIGSQEQDIAYIWQNAWHPRTRTVDMRLSIFVQQADESYGRIEEIQTQRAYTREELTQYLTEAGFTGIRFYGDRTLRAPTAKAARWHVTAIRPKENAK